METNKQSFVVNDTDTGMRLDRFLTSKIPTFSRSEIQRFSVTRGDKPVRMSERVRVGDVFDVIIPSPSAAPQNGPSVGHDFDLDILYEDDDIIVVNKPRGVVMYPSAGNLNGTLVQNVLAHTSLSMLGGTTRPGVVHRLDKDTSGVMVLAKSDAAYRGLVRTFMTHDLTRKYVAFVWGIPHWTEADITGNIARSSRNRQKMTMVKTGGRDAHTSVAVGDVWTRAGVSMMHCTLMTGRTHQIRVHLSAHGFPVLCDPVYGRGSARLGTVRDADLLEFLKTHHGQMLHAAVLDFIHPTTGVPMHFKAHLPDDMAELKAILDEI